MGARSKRSKIFQGCEGASERTSLNEHIAKCGCFDWTREHRDPGAIRRSLAKQAILRPAAHEMKCIYRYLAQIGCSQQRGSEGGSDAVDYRSNEPGSAIQRSSLRQGQQRLDARRHVARKRQGFMVRIKHGTGWSFASCLLKEVRKVDVLAIFCFPRAYRFAEKPQSRDVVQKSEATIDTKFVRVVCFSGSFSQDRPSDFQPDKTPSPAGDIRRVPRK